MKSILLLYFSSFVWSSNAVVLQDIEKKVENGKAVIEYTFNDRVDSRKVSLDFINQTIQLDVPNAYLEEKKRFTSVEDSKIKSLYSYQLDNETLRLRVIYNDLESKGLDGKIKTAFSGNVMRVSIDDGRVPLKAMPDELPRKMKAPTIQIEDILVSDGENSVEKVEPAVSVEVTQDKTIEEVKKEAAYDETSIPVFAKIKNNEKNTKQSAMSNVAMAIGIGFLALIGLFLLLRRWSKVKYKNPHTHIKVLTQHHLGPKKTLAIVSVAGESILLGITENNINMIKSLSLLDEEVPGDEDVPASFDQAYDQAEENIENKEDGIEEDTFNVMGIKDVVKTRLQNMRQL